MKNIIIYTKNSESSLEAYLAQNEEYSVRTKDCSEIKDYAILDPALIIIDNVDAAQDALMTNKFPCPILFLEKTRRDFTEAWYNERLTSFKDCGLKEIFMRDLSLRIFVSFTEVCWVYFHFVSIY